jgi:hypothetical protein
MKLYIKQLIVTSFIMANIFAVVPAKAINSENLKPIETGLLVAGTNLTLVKSDKIKVKINYNSQGEKQIDNEPNVKMSKDQEKIELLSQE